MSRMLAPARLLSALLGTAAALHLGYLLTLAFDPDDAGRLETTLVLSVSGQLDRGFGTLYGPYSGSNPLVLMHAPLYYRLAALGAWPLARLGGRDALTASLVVGG